jgi:hypothetical protein
MTAVGIDVRVLAIIAGVLLVVFLAYLLLPKKRS